jgi:hypothetical protein
VFRVDGKLGGAEHEGWGEAVEEGKGTEEMIWFTYIGIATVVILAVIGLGIIYMSTPE